MHLHPQSALLYNCTKWIRDVSALLWRTETCSFPFCGNPNYPVFIKNFFIIYLFTLFFTLHVLRNVRIYVI